MSLGFRSAACACCAATLAACAGNPQQLPVSVSVCSAVAGPLQFDIVARVVNQSDRPISRMDLAAAFYQNFRYQKYTASAHLQQELDPGQKRNVTFVVGEAPSIHPQGQAIRCFVTHIGYLDGTTQDAPPSQ